MGKFVIKRNGKGNYHFALKARNGETIAVSEVYASLAGCEGGIASVQKNAPVSPVEDQSSSRYSVLHAPKFELYCGADRQFRFRLKASNGEILLASEGYTTKANCQNGISSVKDNAPEAAIIMEE